MSSEQRYARWAAAGGPRPVALRCRLGLHRYRWLFVGSSWQPDDHVKACVRCGVEPR